MTRFPGCWMCLMTSAISAKGVRFLWVWYGHVVLCLLVYYQNPSENAFLTLLLFCHVCGGSARKSVRTTVQWEQRGQETYSTDSEFRDMGLLVWANGMGYGNVFLAENNGPNCQKQKKQTNKKNPKPLRYLDFESSKILQNLFCKCLFILDKHTVNHPTAL